MKKAIILLLLALCVGCSEGVYHDLAEVEMRMISPLLALGSELPVVYPGISGVKSAEPMVQAFGPAWEGIEQDHPAYNFNP